MRLSSIDLGIDRNRSMGRAVCKSLLARNLFGEKLTRDLGAVTAGVDEQTTARDKLADYEIEQ